MIYSSLIGLPVEHSISPVLFDYLSKKNGLEYSHLKIDVPSKTNLEEYLFSLRKLGFCGTNVTLPYKLDVGEYMDEISDEAKKIGAINTIVFGDKVIGYNTDSKGALLAIETKLKTVNSEDEVLVIGAGGAARAIIYALYEKTKNIIILNRDLKEAQILSKDISGGLIPVMKLSPESIRETIDKSDIIINATPVGMSPNGDDRIVELNILDSIEIKNKYFFDAIFNPYKTNFLKDAEKRGAKICSGTYMMIFQAIEAFYLWTGKKDKHIDIEEINSILVKHCK